MRSLPTSRLVPLALVSVLALAACAEPPQDEVTSSTTTTAGSSAPAADALPCLATDVGGVNDKSFSQSANEGLLEGAQALGLESIVIEARSANDYAPNIASLVDQQCTLIVSVGFLQADATRENAEANPDIDFTTVDDDSVKLPNVRPITFDSAQPSFLAGYLAASHSTTGKVGTFGGAQIPPVTAFMDGFALGVEYYNEKHGTDVEVVGWDPVTQVGVFTGNFVAGPEAKSAAQGILDQDVDVIFAVGGPIFQSAGEAIKDANREVAMVGVDVDLYDTAPDYQHLFITSVLRRVSEGVKDSIDQHVDGTFSDAPYVGTLENGGVDIAPFHDFEDRIPAEIVAELDEVRAGIIDGSIATTP